MYQYLENVIKKISLTIITKIIRYLAQSNYKQDAELDFSVLLTQNW